MLLVMVFYNSDGFTYSCKNALPFKASSPEQALVDLEKLIIETNEQSKINWKGEFTFCGLKLSSDLFYCHERSFSDIGGNLELPEIYTIEEWYNSEQAS